MIYDFGEIFDARKSPDGHFVVVVGEVTENGQTKVMYYLITSRVYAVFKDILDFFNDCIRKGDQHFFRKFNKEKKKEIINPHGSLCQAVFLDKYTNYDTCLDVDSMIVVNRDPELMDETVFKSFERDGKWHLKTKLEKLDALNLKEMIKHSDNISPDKKNKIFAAFNKVDFYKKATSHP